jgi:hypothetical protein
MSLKSHPFIYLKLSDTVPILLAIYLTEMLMLECKLLTHHLEKSWEDNTKSSLIALFFMGLC